MIEFALEIKFLAGLIAYSSMFDFSLGKYSSIIENL
jgi:hypothetical protein